MQLGINKTLLAKKQLALDFAAYERFCSRRAATADAILTATKTQTGTAARVILVPTRKHAPRDTPNKKLQNCLQSIDHILTH